jgi:hypothetical protein
MSSNDPADSETTYQTRTGVDLREVAESLFKQAKAVALLSDSLRRDCGFAFGFFAERLWLCFRILCGEAVASLSDSLRRGAGLLSALCDDLGDYKDDGGDG